MTAPLPLDSSASSARLVNLCAGPLTACYTAGELRRICLGSRELVRRIYAPVRDLNWDTIPLRVGQETVEETGEGFRLGFEAAARLQTIAFAWQGTIVGSPDGTIEFTFAGQALTSFTYCRIGFCVNHPIRECAGLPCEVEHADGSTEPAAFPRLIAAQSPLPPFLNLRALRHAAGDEGLTLEIRLEGDLFELEDQRNWTDASFKTYCTPLAASQPRKINAGDRVFQRVTLRLLKAAAADHRPDRSFFRALDSSRGPIRLHVGETCGRLPAIGLGESSHGEALSPLEIRRLRDLNLSHLRTEVRLADPDWPDRLRRAARQALELGAALEVALFLSDQDSSHLARLAEVLAELHVPIASFLIFSETQPASSAKHLREARRLLSPAFPPAAICGGTNADFYELNGNRPEISLCDALCFSINPQVHTADETAIMESLEAQGTTIETAREFGGGRPVRVSPVTLKPRFNPAAIAPAMPPAPGMLPAAVDPRQRTLFAAAWTLGTLRSLGEAGAAGITFFETTGWRGIMERGAGSLLPEEFPSRPGEVFPVYHVLADVAPFVGAQVLRTTTSHPLDVAALALAGDGRLRLLIANFTEYPRPVRLSAPFGNGRMRVLDAASEHQAAFEPELFARQPEFLVCADNDCFDWTLPPYAVARLDNESA